MMTTTINKKIWVTILAVLIIMVSVIVITKNTGKSTTANKTADEEAFHPEYFKVNEGWGYCILHNKKMVIRQEFIPAIQNRVAFSTKEDAKKTAELIISKLIDKKKPTINMAELDSMDIVMP